MGDEFDGCECVWTHELAMQRLLNFIRQNQNQCTDTECIDVSGRMREQMSSPGAGGDDNGFVFMTMLMVLALLMYFIRPDSIMKLTNTKRRALGQDPHHDAPPPPPPAPPSVN